MKVSILIVTFGRDFQYLKYCLRSIAKFATGFHEVVVAIPMHESWEDVLEIANDYHGPIPMRFFPFDEWKGLGFVHHMNIIMHAEKVCPDADFIAHMDADCVFMESVTPEDYFVNGLPVMLMERYENLIARHNANLRHWQIAVHKAIGEPMPTYEFMRRHPAVHYRSLYPVARKMVVEQTKMPFEEYLKTTKNDYPQTFAEFPTLGEVAFRTMYDKYHWINEEHTPRPKDKLRQAWSHRDPTSEDLQIFNSLGLA